MSRTLLRIKLRVGLLGASLAFCAWPCTLLMLFGKLAVHPFVKVISRLPWPPLRMYLFWCSAICPVPVLCTVFPVEGMLQKQLLPHVEGECFTAELFQWVSQQNPMCLFHIVNDVSCGLSMLTVRLLWNCKCTHSHILLICTEVHSRNISVRRQRKYSSWGLGSIGMAPVLTVRSSPYFLLPCRSLSWLCLLGLAHKIAWFALDDIVWGLICSGVVLCQDPLESDTVHVVGQIILLLARMARVAVTLFFTKLLLQIPRSDGTANPLF